MNFLKNFMSKSNKKLLVTHSGSFHADEVFACASLCIMLEEAGESFEIKRTRNEDEIKKGDFVFDVGGIYDPEINRFDHHQPGGAGKRENGIEYSSFGLVWKKFGSKVAGGAGVAKRVDDRIVQIIDADDNGIDIFISGIPNVSNYSIYDAINAFHPSYTNVTGNIDSAFSEALNFAKLLLKKEIIKAQDQEEVFVYIKEKISELNNDDKILVLDKYIPRVEIWNEMINYPQILFVVSPGNPEASMWKVLGLRIDMSSFKLRRDLPSAWGGLKDEELAKIAGVPDVIFCHRGLFMAVAHSKEGTVKLAELALK